MEILNIGIITHPGVKKEFVWRIVEKLGEDNIYFDPVAAEKLGRKKTEVGDMKVDLAVILGGDGTLLWSVNELKGNPLILGINTGGVGYLAELNMENALAGIGKLLKGDFFIDERMKLKVDDGYEALNEFVILPESPAALLEFRIMLGGEELTEFRADGVLVSTQTGSTGHALSLGGPIIHPDSRVYLLAPMIPFMRGQASLIIPDSSRIEIKLLRENRGAHLISDGNIIKALKPQSTVSIEKSRRGVKFVRLSGDKMKWKIRKIC